MKLCITPGQTHDPMAAAQLLSELKACQMVLADKAHEADWIRALVVEQDAWANIPPTSNRKDPICFSPHLYKVRNAAERFCNKSNTRGVSLPDTTNAGRFISSW